MKLMSFNVDYFNNNIVPCVIFIDKDLLSIIMSGFFKLDINTKTAILVMLLVYFVPCVSRIIFLVYYYNVIQLIGILK